MSANKQWIPCNVAPGMFTDERAVEVEGRWFFVEARYVQAAQRTGPGLLEVVLFEEGGNRWAMIPSCYREAVALRA